jgi:hypothetical protein
MENKYNGWTNYATWRVSLEMIDGNQDHYLDMMNDDNEIDTYELSKIIEADVIEILENEANDQSIVFSYAQAFVSNVNWYEIAEHIAEELNA